MTSTLCLQSTNAEARIALEYRDNNHVVIGQYGSNPAQGNNGALNQFSVNKTGPRISSAAVNHVHVQIQEKVNGSWQDVPGAFKFADYP